MGSSLTFDDVVAARTRTARHVLANQDLLAQYLECGGLPSDLERIAQAGEKAERVASARGAVKADVSAATLDVLAQFTDLQSRYSAIMAVLQAVLMDLEDEGAAPELIAKVKGILKNETPVVFRTIEKDGNKKKVAVRSKAQEAIRAEIQRDAEALLDLKDVHPFLARRKVSQASIKDLRNDARALAGKFAERTVQRGAGKAATTEVHDAVAQQNRAWGGCYRILALLGQSDERVRSLLAEAAR